MIWFRILVLGLFVALVTGLNKLCLEKCSALKQSFSCEDSKSTCTARQDANNAKCIKQCTALDIVYQHNIGNVSSNNEFTSLTSSLFKNRNTHTKNRIFKFYSSEESINKDHLNYSSINKYNSEVDNSGYNVKQVGNAASKRLEKLAMLALLGLDEKYSLNKSDCNCQMDLQSCQNHAKCKLQARVKFNNCLKSCPRLETL